MRTAPGPERSGAGRGGHRRVIDEEHLAHDGRGKGEHHRLGSVGTLYAALPGIFLPLDLDLAPSIVTVSNAGELADGPLVREARDVAVLKPEAEPPEELRLRVPVALRVT